MKENCREINKNEIYDNMTICLKNEINEQKLIAICKTD